MPVKVEIAVLGVHVCLPNMSSIAILGCLSFLTAMYIHVLP